MARARSHEAHEKVIRAAIHLFGERGIDATSMDAIAHASGVSKATIYNHWEDKEALLMEVMLFVNGLGREPEDVDTGNIARDLATVLTRRPPDELEAERNRITPTLIAYSAVHADFGQAWRNRVMERPRQCLRKILCRGVERGVLPADLDLDLSMALLLGPGLYTHIFDRGDLPKSRKVGTEAAYAFCRAYLPTKHRRAQG